MRLSVKAVKRELRNAARRKGGKDRLRIEATFSLAMMFARMDNYVGEAEEYIRMADRWFGGAALRGLKELKRRHLRVVK
jgi:hypothetical protein